MDQQAEKKEKKEGKKMRQRVTGLGRRTREEIANWNQMTALRFQTGGRHQTSPASLQGNQHTASDVRHIAHHAYRQSLTLMYSVELRAALLVRFCSTGNSFTSFSLSQLLTCCTALEQM